MSAHVSGSPGGTRWQGTDRAARMLLSRVAEPYDDKVKELVARVGVTDLVGYLVSGQQQLEGVKLGRFQSRLATALDVDEVKVCRALGARCLVPADEEWPPELDQLPDPPWCLWVRGPLRVSELGKRSVAIVGSRASTSYGDQVTAALVTRLAERGFVIVSGAAYGIDAAAHRAALAVGGDTVTVLASGVDVAYPRANAELIGRIGNQGAIVSETPPGGAPVRMRFLSRNRIIAALTTGTVIVEAGLRSGARSTTRQARELGRPVMAVPGPVTSVMSTGCHQEIRSGAELVCDADEVAELVGRIGADLAPEKRGEELPEDALAVDVRRVWQWLRPGKSVTVDELVIRSGMDLSEVISALVGLEADGMAEQLLDGWQRRKASA